LILLAQHYARNDKPDKAYFLFERAEGIEKYEAEARLRHAQTACEEDALRGGPAAAQTRPGTASAGDVARYLDQVERAARARSN